MSNILDKPEVNTARWKAVAEYRSEAGVIDVEHGIEEIEDLHDLIERGPDWRALIKITIILNRVDAESLTVEQAARL